MAAGVNRYLADLRELEFVLFEQFGLTELLGKPPFEAWGPEEVKAVLDQSYRFAREVLGPLNASGDREGCRLEAGAVITPKGFKDAWRQLYEAGFKSLSVSPAHGGQGAPNMLYGIIEELLCANPAFNMYPGLAFGAAELIGACGTPDQVHKYVEKMSNGTWGGTMCLTESDAGSDVGSAKTQALKQKDGTYRIKGTKIFISGGDHDLAENIIHLVLARVENAPPGTKGLSLFIVPKRKINADGSSGAANDVQVASIEHKMGINGSATCVLNFGESDNCVGELVGTLENVGMSQMFKMMNGARIGVAIQSVSVASTSYLNALEYAKERRQGANFKVWKDPTKPRVPILEHPDVRRMLIDGKAHVEGIRALLVKVTSHLDRAAALAGSDDEKAAYHRGQVELLTPLLKGFGADEAFRLCGEMIQVYGGAGFLKDHPVEQACRDSKIFSIYEGTTHIQAMDLVGRKLGQSGGAHFQQFMADISGFVEAHRADARYGSAVEGLGKAQEAVMQSAMAVLGWSQDEGKVHLIPLAANRFLKMMSQLTLGWLLLEQAAISEKKLASLPATAPDRMFYEGKRHGALYFARNILPEVEHGARILSVEDASAFEMPDGGFAAG